MTRLKVLPFKVLASCSLPEHSSSSGDASLDGARGHFANIDTPGSGFADDPKHTVATGIWTTLYRFQVD